MTSTASDLFPELRRFVAGRWWLASALCICFLVGALANYTPIFVRAVVEPLPEPVQGYLYKIDHPWADSFLGLAPQEHAPKLTPRVLPALLLHALPRHPASAYTVQFLCGLGILLVGMAMLHAETRDRTLVLAGGLVLALMPPVALALASTPYLFDPLAFLFAGLVVAARQKPWLAGPLLVAGMWCDERVILGGLVAAAAALFQRQPWREVWTCWGALALGALVYFLTRQAAFATLGWPADAETIRFAQLVSAWKFAPLTAAMVVEGGAILGLFLGWRLARDRAWPALAALVAAYTLLGIACVTVADMSRTACFGYPLVLVLLAEVARRATRETARVVVALALGACLLVPTCVLMVFGGYRGLWVLPPTPLKLLAEAASLVVGPAGH
ncbi:MAG: hypothetical protein AAGK14_05280 [Verrucomicrobiota bacterium]